MRSMQIPADPEEKMTSKRRVAEEIIITFTITESKQLQMVTYLNPKQNTIIRVKLFGLGCNQMYSL